MRFETLEPRILLSADLGMENPDPGPQGQDATVAIEQPLDHAVNPAASNAGDVPVQGGTGVFESRTELVILDASVPGNLSLLDGLREASSGNVSYEVHQLDGDRDGFDQIGDILDGRSGVDALHIFSHGSSARLTLGATTVGLPDLDRYGDELGSWGASFEHGADILLYGCDVASGESGVNFVESLASLTGLDVAASSNATGAALHSGDWILEVSSGQIATTALTDFAYPHLLFNLNGTAGGDTLWLDGWGTAADGIIQYSWNSGASWSQHTLACDLLIDLGAGDDTVVFLGFDTSFSSRLQIVGGGGNDTIIVNPGVAITAGQIDWGAETITITGSSLTAAGTITFEAVAVDNSWDGHAQASITINGATLSGSTISIAASTSVTADAGLDLGLPLDVALINTHSNAIVSISGTSQINSTGAVTITATSTTATTALAKANSLAGSVTADAAVATSVVDGSAAVRVTGTTAFSVAGALSLSASNTRSVTTTADGSAGGDTAAGGSVAVAVVTGDTEAYLGESAKVISAGSLSISASKLDNIATSAKSTSGGAVEAAGSTETKSRLSEYKAETSSGAVTIAGAVAVTNLNGHTWAYVASNQAVTTSGSLSVESLDNSDASAKADGSSVGSASVGVGAGVAINIAKIDNQAYLGGTGTITAQGAVVRAGFASESGESPSRHVLSAEAISGASGGSVGVAGALALNIVDAQSVAAVKSGADVAITGGKDATLTAENATVSTATAQPANAGAVAGSVGIGASVALNIANTRTVAALADGAVLTGARDLSLSATSDNSVITEAKAGGAATGGSGVGIGGAIATSVVSNDTQAVLGSGGLQTVTGDLKAVATHTGSTTTFADGSAG
ncbi:MAG: DUF4347 domain-containing protein, partial [Desulfomicrobium sp.]|nr:DUF4347 domain-containing protein [Desulfomicrobium sp.]